MSRAPRTPETITPASLVAAHALSSREPIAAERAADEALTAYGRALHLGAVVKVDPAQVPATFAALCWAARQVPDHALVIADLLAAVR